MSHLSENAAKLVRLGRETGRPTAGDRERILAALLQKLGDGVVSGRASALPRPRRVGRLFWLVAAALTVGLAASAATSLGMWHGVSQASAKKAEPPAQIALRLVPPQLRGSQAGPVDSAAAERSPLSSGARSSIEASGSAMAGAGEVASGVPHRRHDRLAEEVAILSRATNSLQSGRASEALRVLEEHQRKFANGELTEERYAARIQALCALGRRSEATAELARLSRMAPGSPHLSRAREYCAKSASEADAPVH